MAELTQPEKVKDPVCVMPVFASMGCVSGARYFSGDCKNLS